MIEPPDEKVYSTIGNVVSSQNNSAVIAAGAVSSSEKAAEDFVDNEEGDVGIESSASLDH